MSLVAMFIIKASKNRANQELNVQANAQGQADALEYQVYLGN